MGKESGRSLPGKLGAIVLVAATAGLVFVLWRLAQHHELISSWGSYGDKPGQFDSPTGIAIGGSGRVYVSDQNNCRLQVFSPRGSLMAQIAPKLGEPGRLSCPNGVAITRMERVYAAAMNGNTVSEFNGPSDLALDARGNVYVVDALNYRIQKFTPDGEFVLKWGSKGTAPGQFSELRGIAIDAKGRVYVPDRPAHRVQVFTSEGKYITEWQVRRPEGIALDGNDVYVSSLWWTERSRGSIIYRLCIRLGWGTPGPPPPDAPPIFQSRMYRYDLNELLKGKR